MPPTPGLMSWWTSGSRSWPGFQVFALLLHPDSLSWLTYAAMEAQPSDENKTCGFQAAGLEFGVPFSPLLLPRISTELTRCLPGSRTRSRKPGDPQRGQCGPASLPTSSVQLTQGRQHPQKDQEMWAVLWSKCLGQLSSARPPFISAHALFMDSCDAACTQFCIVPVFMHISCSALSPHSNSYGSLEHCTEVVMHTQEQLYQPQPRVSFTAPSY